MGRTLPSASMIVQSELGDFAAFKRALSTSDQRLLEEVYLSAQKHAAEIAYAAHPLPFYVMLLSMILEEHKLVTQIKAEHERQLQQITDLQRMIDQVRWGFEAD